MLNKKKIIIAGCAVLVILIMVTLLVIMGNRKNNGEELPVENNNNKVTAEAEENNGNEVIDKDSNGVSESADEGSNDKSEDETSNDKSEEDQNNNNKPTVEAGDISPDDKKDDEKKVENKLSREDVLTLLCGTEWHEIGMYTYLAVTFSEAGTFNLWDTVGNPCMMGDFSIDTENMQITLDCSEDADFDPPFTIPKLSNCSFYFTEGGYFCIEYQTDKLLFKMDKNVKADIAMKGYIWNASSASDGSDVSELKLDLGDYFALYDMDTIYFASELYSIGTVDGYITVNWSGYSNNNEEYEFTYSILPYVKLDFWDLSDKTLSVEDATDTFEEDMKLQFAYSLNKETLELKYKGVAITFTRGEASAKEDEAIQQKK
jgi:hypothetical protein